MSGSATPALIGIVVGIISTLITIFLTPRVQFYFWRRQRLSEIRLAAINEINNLAADFLTNYISNTKYHPADQFFASFMAASANIEALFSEKAFVLFKGLEVMIGPNLGPGKGSVDAFVKARDIALRALYQEAIGQKSKHLIASLNRKV